MLERHHEIVAERKAAGEECASEPLSRCR